MNKLDAMRMEGKVFKKCYRCMMDTALVPESLKVKWERNSKADNQLFD